MTDAPASSAPEALARLWRQRLDLAERERRDYVDEGRKVVERYLNQRDKRSKGQRRLGILYSNTETLAAALYAKSAKPDVRRRFSDRDPVGQQVAEMIERALTYFDDVGNVDSAIEAGIQDFLLPGRGVVRIEYEPIIDQRQATDPVTGRPLFEADDDGVATEEPAMVDFLADQKIHHHHVFWEDFLCSPARRWADVSWVAFRHTMSRDDIEEQVYDNAGDRSKTYGKPDKVPLDWMPDIGKKKEEVSDEVKKAEVWEVWDKPTATRLWLVKTFPTPLRVDQDPYEIEGFFPLPEPIAAFRTNDSVIPRALYKAYEDQAEDLDEITRRISILTKAMRRRGVYNQAVPELKRLATAADNEYIASPNFAALSSTGGLPGNFLTEDISTIASVLLELYKQREMLVQSIYEITGIADIMRGSTDPGETLGAQQLKSQFGSMRLKKMQQAVQRWVRDLNRIKVDLMCRHFEPQVLQSITNMQVTPEIMQTLQSDQMRGYRVDIETDSTVFQDATALQQERTGLIQGLTQLWQAWGPMVAQRPDVAPLLFELTKFGLAPAHDARPVQDAVDELAAKVEQQPPQAPGQQQDPAALAKAQTAQMQAQAAQIKAQSEAARGQTAVQVAQIGAQAELSTAQIKAQGEALKLQQQREAHMHDMALRQQQHDQAMAQAQQRQADAARTQQLGGGQT